MKQENKSFFYELKNDIKRFILSLFSRSTLVWITGTALLIFNKINQDTWLMLTFFYLGYKAVKLINKSMGKNE